MFKPQVINRFNLYRNGSVLIGISGEVELPEVTNLTDTLEGSGTGGNLEVPVIGLTDTMDMKIPYTTLSKSAFAMMDPNETVDLMLNGAKSQLLSDEYSCARRCENLFAWNSKSRRKDGFQRNVKPELLQNRHRRHDNA